MSEVKIPQISKHAIDKFCQITGCKDRSKARTKIREMFKRARKAEIENRRKVERIINNEFVEADYYEFHQFRFVVAGNLMVTFEEKY